MSLFFEDGDFTIPVPTGPLRRAPAFNGDKKFYFYEQDYLQFFTEFVETNLNTPHPIVADAYLIEETPLQEYGCGLAKWTRRYCKKPDQRTHYESHAHTFPGLTPGGLYIPKTLDPTGVLGSGVHTLETPAGAHGYLAGDFVFIKVISPYLVDGGVSPYVNMIYQVRREVLTVPTSTTFTVAEIPGIDPQFIYVVKASDGRKPFSKSVMSKVVFDYYIIGDPLVDPAFTEFDTIPILTPTEIIDGSGLTADTYGAETLPTQTAYLATLGDWEVAENSVIRPWLGNIYERATRYIQNE